MILTNCAACAAPLPRPAKQCSRCKTPYCSPACQKQHWDAGGHKDFCKKIKKGGGAEQYHADKKTKEAIAEAVEKCADDTRGQACYICTQAVHWKTKEGLVRMCACRGTAGFVHVSCLAEQAKILVAEVEKSNLAGKDKMARWKRWEACSLCKQQYHGVVFCALGWACWKTYVGRPEGDSARQLAMAELGNGLHDAKRHKEALSVYEAELSMMRRFGKSEDDILRVQGNLATTYHLLGRYEEAISMRRDVYSGFLRLNGAENVKTLHEAYNIAQLFVSLGRLEEAKRYLRSMMHATRRVLGESHDLTLKMRLLHGQTLYCDKDASLDDLREAVTIGLEKKQKLKTLKVLKVKLLT